MNNDVILKFPSDYLNHKYGLIHFNFFVQYAKVAAVTVELVEPGKRVFISQDQLVASCLINDLQVIIDYADHNTRDWKSYYPNVPYFKFQTTTNNSKNLIPLGPPIIGFKRKGHKAATLREYNHVKWHYNYQPDSAVLCKQLPNGAAVDRRNHVHQLLQTNFDQVDVSADSDQIDFWKAHENCLAAVCVPGATNNMVDRGQMELIGLGVCTVSPRPTTLFPWHQELEPDRHYIQCADDYSDLVDIVKNLQHDREKAKAIGDAAREFYNLYYSPTKYWQWIVENLQNKGTA